MAFKTLEEILTPDSRFENNCVVEPTGVRLMNLADHHEMIERAPLAGTAPADVRDAYDRARNTLLYAYFDYDLMVVAEVQAFGAFELALKHRLNGHGLEAKGTLRNLIDRARKQKIFPALPPCPPDTPIWLRPSDRVEAMLKLRNDLAHGTSAIHTVGIAMNVLEACAWRIDTIFPVSVAETRRP
jgi:hypothetical protein